MTWVTWVLAWCFVGLLFGVNCSCVQIRREGSFTPSVVPPEAWWLVVTIAWPASLVLVVFILLHRGEAVNGSRASRQDQ